VIVTGTRKKRTDIEEILVDRSVSSWVSNAFTPSCVFNYHAL
jgi:hypothetical protein